MNSTLSFYLFVCLKRFSSIKIYIICDILLPLTKRFLLNSLFLTIFSHLRFFASLSVISSDKRFCVKGGFSRVITREDFRKSEIFLQVF